MRPAELETPAARDFRAWLERIGARLVVLDSDEHDRVVSLTSHLPQLASTALASLVGDVPRLEVSGSGIGGYDAPRRQFVRPVAGHSGD